jgi:hypothetical protein
MRNGAGEGEGVKRLLKIIFDALAVVSLLLCGTTAILWVKSYYRADSVSFTAPWHQYGVSASRGELLFASSLNYLMADANEREINYIVEEPDDLSAPNAWMKRWGVTGFYVFAWAPPGHNMIAGGVLLPLWFVTTAFTLLPLRWQLQRRKRNRKPPGMCATCVYDLRATPERCPECGNAP